jgi:hypothetical protein
MSFYRTTCPYCFTEQVSFESVAAKPHINDPKTYTVFFCCNHCGGGIVLSVKCTASQLVDPHSYPGVLLEGTLEEIGFKILRVRPEVKSVDMPAHLPKKIQESFRQAADHSRKKGFEDSSGMMCRKILETALSNIAPNITGMNLEKRIDKCAENQLITPALKDWAHRIRIFGNDAAHEELNSEQVKDLFNFTYMFLIYVFTLPGMIKEKQNNLML